jgi:hypothetical protein
VSCNYSAGIYSHHQLPALFNFASALNQIVEFATTLGFECL